MKPHEINIVTFMCQRMYEKSVSKLVGNGIYIEGKKDPPTLKRINSKTTTMKSTH